MNKCIFLDRDGVLNYDPDRHIWLPEEFRILDAVPEAIANIRAAGFLVVVITNQSGIAQEKYTRAHVDICHELLQKACNYNINGIYYAPGHPTKSTSISRKPDRLLFQKAIAKFNIDPSQSWMLGDKERDLIPARQLGMNTVFINKNNLPSQELDTTAANIAPNLPTATKDFLLA